MQQPIFSYLWAFPGRSTSKTYISRFSTQTGRSLSSFTSRPMPIPSQDLRLSVLHQAIEPPLINGIRKPMKPGGYQDSGADIAFALSNQLNIQILTPQPTPDPANQTHWSFPDTESGILSALQAGATHLWANTILFSAHPLQTSPLLDQYQDKVRIVGQPPNLVEAGDDKARVNDFLRRRKEGFTLPRGWTVTSSSSQGISSTLASLGLPYPVVGKPVRGRGSFGVKVCSSQAELEDHVSSLFEDSSIVMIEEFLAGEEATISVMPPSPNHPKHWALPIVTRFNHQDGIAPYNGTVAVTANSRVVTMEEYANDRTYMEAEKECEGVARLLGATAPIRIDIRRFGREEKFALFDINMKPNMTGPGRPGREDQASLTALAAKGVDMDYTELLMEILGGAITLRKLREVDIVL